MTFLFNCGLTCIAHLQLSNSVCNEYCIKVPRIARMTVLIGKQLFPVTKIYNFLEMHSYCGVNRMDVLHWTVVVTMDNQNVPNTICVWDASIGVIAFVSGWMFALSFRLALASHCWTRWCCRHLYGVNISEEHECSTCWWRLRVWRPLEKLPRCWVDWCQRWWNAEWTRRGCLRRHSHCNGCIWAMGQYVDNIVNPWTIVSEYKAKCNGTFDGGVFSTEIGTEERYINMIITY